MASRDVTHQSDISKMKVEADGSFKRAASQFRNTIEEGGQFPPEKDRYHLYVSYACPWASRTLIMRKLKGLEDFLNVTVVSPHMGTDGWPFASVDSFPGAEEDPLYGSQHVKDLYLRADPTYNGRFTVPVLWDKKQHTIVNNESSEIIRIFNTAFNKYIPEDKAALDFYPTELRKEIDEVNEWVYDRINNGVYKSGFATTFPAYRAAVLPLFEALDRVEGMLAGKTYLIGDRLTEADIRLYVTIVRFDPVYVGHFKCNIRTIRGGYPNIHAWLRRLYWTNNAFQSTTDFEHIKTHYYWAHTTINPHRIVPIGPVPHIEPLGEPGRL
ncbi:glutathione S-transferase [Artomyces pyxidatus]|uniref:Glutathione S-transferase n=1 Tax=Artomyces pyxidatus TaxID=48021 RepID=A0ACB8TEC0_9AGAM|nr:glutathione S-transferase [Artomyces pyxidatus]